MLKNCKKSKFPKEFASQKRVFCKIVEKSQKYDIMESANNSQSVRFFVILGVFLMYISSDVDQITMEEFFMPFGGKLLKTNRWVKLASMMPWEHIERIYMASFQSERGRPAISSRIAFGSIFIKENDNLTDEGTVAAIAENPYMQYFLGLTAFQAEPLFDPSMMVHFRKRFPVEEVAKINEYICTGKWPEQQRNVDRNDGQDDTQQDENQKSPAEKEQKQPPKSGKRDKNTSKKKLKREKKQKKNRGKLILDATVAPADIKYPTDIDLLNKSREHLETAVTILWKEVPHKGHKLPYSPKKARKSYLSLAKSKKWTEAKCRTALGDQLRCIEQAAKRLEELKALVPDYEKRFPTWLHRRLGVIPLVYAQQRQMYDSHTHKCEDRIVSLEQPHVRPIQRGKRPNPTEFGQKLHLSVVDGFTFLEQTSWSNFNEGCDLTAAVEDYYRKFGCYPEAVLADKIYQTRANRTFCKEKGIRLTGPALGRPKTGEADRKQKRQMYKDACDRNAVEGRNGNAKRRFGLDLIAAKLDETAKTEAALILTAMNAANKLARWLLRLFAESPLFRFLSFQQKSERFFQ